MKFLQTSDGDLINLDNIELISFDEDSLTISFISGGDMSYDYNKKDTNSRIKYEDFVKRLRSLIE